METLWYILRGKIYKILVHLLISHLTILASMYGEPGNLCSYLLAADPKALKLITN